MKGTAVATGLLACCAAASARSVSVDHAFGLDKEVSPPLQNCTPLVDGTLQQVLYNVISDDLFARTSTAWRKPDRYWLFLWAVEDKLMVFPAWNTGSDTYIIIIGFRPSNTINFDPCNHRWCCITRSLYSTFRVHHTREAKKTSVAPLLL